MGPKLKEGVTFRCPSCHDRPKLRERCAICHGAGRTADTDEFFAWEEAARFVEASRQVGATGTGPAAPTPLVRGGQGRTDEEVHSGVVAGGIGLLALACLFAILFILGGC